MAFPKKSNSRIEIDLERELNNIPQYRRSEIQSHLALFRRYDTDKDGKISRVEFETVRKEMLSRAMGQTRLDLLDAPFPDYNEDGYIGIIEFLAFVRSFA
jgi:Ca2+-binding EF-hand superfamily protein